jgi:hypothetical protein
MGGAGSGTWHRGNTRTTLDDVTRLDIRWLQREGYVPHGPQTVPTTVTESIMLVDNFLVLHNGYGLWGRQDGQPEWHVIELAWTPCHYGGQRPWWLCPQCQRRCAVLYVQETRFVCRFCLQLPYGSRQETVWQRRYRKALKIRKRLGVSGNLLEALWPWDKPKGMHWRTWERLSQHEAAVRSAILGDLAARLPRAGGEDLKESIQGGNC